jgi:aspartyl-tRNA(Asn)/glutamyl-tRNA(Gln) amidotransferase subunit C
MAKVSVATVEHLARLARLSLTPEESVLFARQIEDILVYAESLQAIDTTAVAPMSHARTAAALREDTPTPSLDRKAALDPAPDAADGLFRVPRVIGG